MINEFKFIYTVLAYKVSETFLGDEILYCCITMHITASLFSVVKDKGKVTFIQLRNDGAGQPYSGVSKYLVVLIVVKHNQF